MKDGDRAIQYNWLWNQPNCTEPGFGCNTQTAHLSTILDLRSNGIKYHTNQLKQQPVGLEQINDKITKDLRPQQRQSNRFCNKKINQPI